MGKLNPFQVSWGENPSYINHKAWSIFSLHFPNSIFHLNRKRKQNKWAEAEKLREAVWEGSVSLGYMLVITIQSKNSGMKQKKKKAKTTETKKWMYKKRPSKSPV